MRVTKIIREYVEREIRKKRDEALASIPEAKPLYEQEEFKARYEEYLTFAEDLFNDFLVELAGKREELNIPIKEGDIGGRKNHDENMRFIMFDEMGPYTNFAHPNRLIKDTEFEAYRKQRNDIYIEYDKKIDDILIRLELGEMKKQELEEVLAEV